jgi:peptidoglycan/LPS O-acetylase OafA/YrhL
MVDKIDLESGIRAGSPYLYEVECIRGLAILLVFLFHAYGVSVGGGNQAPGFWMSYIISGNTGVTLFFVLSGFLLSLPWLSYLQGLRPTAPDLADYYRARVLRIAPLYWVAVLLAILLTGKLLVGIRAASFQFVGFEMFPYSVVWWTLATEVQFYLLLPLAFLAFARGGSARLCLWAVLVVWLGAYLWVFVLFKRPDTASSFLLTKSLFGRLPAFLVGITAAVIFLRWRERLRNVATAPNRALSLGLVLVVWLLLGLVLQEHAALGDRRAEWSWHLHHTWEAMLWASLILLLLLVPPLGSAVLVNRPFAVAGKLSYSLYLIHVPVLFYLIYPVKEGMERALYLQSPWLYALPVAALAVSLGLAAVSFRLIELPFLNLKHRVRW